MSDSVRGRLQVTSPMTITGVNNPVVPCLLGPCYAHIRAVAGWTARVMENQSELYLRSVSLRGGNEVMAAGGGFRGSSSPTGTAAASSWAGSALASH